MKGKPQQQLEQKNMKTLDVTNPIHRSLLRRTLPVIAPALVIIAALTFACFALSPAVEAVSPPPDGGYPGQNTAEGQSALLHLSGGTYNTAVGWSSLGFNVAGGLNTAVGAGSLLFNTADQNTATGAGALLSNTTGAFNTAVGSLALLSNTVGTFNSAFGQGALYSNTTGNNNTASGAGALQSNTTGLENTAIGYQALFSESTGFYNTAIGANALFNTTGNFNTAIGAGALDQNTTGFGNVALGQAAGHSVTTASRTICIGNGVFGMNVDNSCFIGSVRDVTTQLNDAIPVLIDGNGQLGTASSSRRYKTDIKPMDRASESILALKPVSFRYKIHKDTTPQFGLIAEDVEKVNRDLVIYGPDGKPHTVRYEAVNAMLLNEFLKEHRTVQAQQKEIEVLKAELKQQGKFIQKVSDEVERNKPARQIVVNNQ